MHTVPDWPEDEYDSYLYPIFSALHKGGGEPAVRVELERALEHMGLEPGGTREDELAGEIVRWYEAAAEDFNAP